MAPLSLTLAALLAGLLGVERKAFLQAMVSRPLAAGSLLGLVLGHPEEGLALGAALELFFLGGVNLGAALPDNELFSAVTAVACGSVLSQRAPGIDMPANLALSVLVALPAAKLGRSADRLSERFNAWAVHRAQRPVDSADRLNSRLRYNLYGLWMPFASTALLCAAGALAADFALAPLAARMVPVQERALSLAWLAFLMVAAAAALRSVKTLRAALWAALAALAGAGSLLTRFYVR